jgi:hypothetical protein
MFIIQTIKKSIQNFAFRRNSNFDPYLLEIYFSLQEVVKRDLLTKFHQIPSSQEFSINFSFISTHRSFLEF